MNLTIDLQLIIDQANELAPFPVSTIRLTQLVSSQECDLSDVVEVVSYDQALTLKLMRAANSAANAGAARVTTVMEAVNRLGTSQMMAIAVAAGARPHLQTSIPEYGLKEGALWKHAVTSAVAAETARAFCEIESPPEVFTAALLHDVGKLVMGRFLGPEFFNRLSVGRELHHLSQLEAESQCLGVHHGELGGLIAAHWQMPPRVIQGIIYHHNPEQGQDVVCDFTYLANEVAKRVEASIEGRKMDAPFQDGIGERLGICATDLSNLCSVVASRLGHLSRRYDAV